MKIDHQKTLVTGLIGIAIAALASSCADPYVSGHGPGPGYHSGHEIRTLPPGYRTETISGTRYYSSNGTYYRSQNDRYVVVEAPHRRPSYNRPPENRGPDRHDGPDRYNGPDRHDGSDRHDGPGRRDSSMGKLPSGYRTETHNGQRYYRVNNDYYQQRGSRYVIVERPR